MRSLRSLSILLACFVTLVASPSLFLFAQKAPSASEILGKMHAVYDAVKNYTADVTVEASIPGINVKPMSAKIYFKQPDKFKVESTGFAMIPRDILLFNSRYLSEEYYDAVVQGEETVDGVRCTKLKLLARLDSLPLQRITLFIDPTQWVPVRMITDPKKGATMDIRLQHTLVKNRYVVPSSITVSMEVPRMSRGPNATGREENKRTPARGTIVVRYRNYRINAGIPDAKFSSTGS